MSAEFPEKSKCFSMSASSADSVYENKSHNSTESYYSTYYPETTNTPYENEFSKSADSFYSNSATSRENLSYENQNIGNNYEHSHSDTPQIACENESSEYFSESAESLYTNKKVHPSAISTGSSHSYPITASETISSDFENIASSFSNTNNIFSVEVKNSPGCINLPLSISTSKTASFLIDTGADVSILKAEIIDNDALVYVDEKIKLKGITGSCVQSLGHIVGKIPLSELTTVSHKFHIVPESLPIPTDGILGNDFLSRNRAVIDFNSQTVTFPISDESNRTFELTAPSLGINENYTVPPRTEKILTFKTIPDDADKVCLQKELYPGVYIANSLINGQNSLFNVSVVNATEEPVTVKRSDIATENIENYDVLNFSGSTTEGRLEKLESELRLTHMNSEERDSILEICRKFNDIFHLEGDKLSHTNSVKHIIPLLSKKPIHVKPYRLPESQKVEVQSQLKKMLEDDIIEFSSSPYNSPILIVPKKPDANGNKRFRLVVDFRKLNDVTESDAYPLPNITEILDQLGRSKYFTVIDLAHGFHQVLLSEESRPLTAFSYFDHYQFKRLPFGLKGSPATFQRLINNVLSGINGLKSFVYMDDICVYGSSLDDHNHKLIEVFERLRKHNLKLQPGKCEFLRKELIYLGHKICQDGVRPDPSKVAAVQNFPTPKNQTQVKSFLGLSSYYRKFILNYAKIAQPLTNLLKKDVKFHWNDNCQESFEKLKHTLVNPPLLQYPDFSQKFNLTTDASQYALGAVLSQGPIGKDLPLSFASRTLNKAERNYSTIEREFLAIVWACQFYRPYLWGRSFRILTDHRPLTYVFSISNPSSRLMKFRLKLEEFQYEIIYKPGKANTNADSLSRIIPENFPENSPETDPELLKVSQNNENHKYFTINKMSISPDLYFDYKVYLETIKTRIIINKNVLDTDDNINNCNKNLSIIYFTDKQFSSAVDYHDNVNELKVQNADLCEIAYLPSGSRYYVYLVIKETSAHFSEYETIFYSLVNLYKFCTEKRISEVAFSSSNIKNEKLKIEPIRVMFRYIFKELNTKINIFHNNVNLDLTANEIKKILVDFHVSPLGGHQGLSRTYKRIKERFKWHNMYNDIKQYIKACETCQRNKCGRKTKTPMVLTSTAKYPMEKIYLDVVGPLNLTENQSKYLLTFQCDLTKFSIAIPIPNQEAVTVAFEFVTKIICQHGIPKVLVTDNGSNFMSNVFKETCKLLRIKQISTTSYHPQANGQVERSHRTLVEYLRNFINRDMNNWDTFIPYACFVYNTTPHVSTNFSPFELLYGRKAELPTSLTKNPEVLYSYEEYYNELKSRMQHASEIARDTILKHKQTSKDYYDRNVNTIIIKVGDKVLLKNEANVKGKSKKLLPLYTGPYDVVEVNSDVNCTILKNRKKEKVHFNRLKLFNE